MASVRLESVSKSYRSRKSCVHAVRELTLEVEDGEFAVLVGPSGCGKTTTLRLLAGLEAPDSGDIRIGDRIVNRVPPKDRDVAMVFQNYALYPHMTVYKNMAFGLKMRKVPRRRITESVQRAAAMLGIEHLLDRKPGSLSGGECQRVALGRAIVREPAVFLFDEPLSNLDASLRLHLRSRIRELHGQLRATMIHVTHDQEEAMTLGDRIAVLHDGLIQQYGFPMDLYARPANRFVAGFIGMPPMNFLRGHLATDGGRLYAHSTLGKIPLASNEVRDGSESPVELGIRPEHLLLSPMDVSARSENPEANSTPARVCRVELLGHAQLVHLATSRGEAVVARAPNSSSFSRGDPVNVTVDPAHLHLFDPGSMGRRLH